MLIKFTDDYINEIMAAYSLIGGIMCSITKQEPFVGDAVELDKLYAYSVLLSGIVDHLSYDDNTNPAVNEGLLLCLRSLLDANLCLPGCVPNVDARKYHETSAVQQTVIIENRETKS